MAANSRHIQAARVVGSAPVLPQAADWIDLRAVCPETLNSAAPNLRFSTFRRTDYLHSLSHMPWKRKLSVDIPEDAPRRPIAAHGPKSKHKQRKKGF